MLNPYQLGKLPQFFCIMTFKNIKNWACPFKNSDPCPNNQNLTLLTESGTFCHPGQGQRGTFKGQFRAKEEKKQVTQHGRMEVNERKLMGKYDQPQKWIAILVFHNFFSFMY